MLVVAGFVSFSCSYSLIVGSGFSVLCCAVLCYFVVVFFPLLSLVVVITGERGPPSSRFF